MKAEEFLEEVKKGSVPGSLLHGVAYDEVQQGKTYVVGGSYKYFYNFYDKCALYWHDVGSNATGREGDLSPVDALRALRHPTWIGTFWHCVMRRAVHYHLSTEEVSALILLDPLCTQSCLIQEALGIKAVA